MIEINGNLLWETPKNFYENNKINKISCTRDIKFPIFKVPSKNLKDIMKIFRRFCPDLYNFDNILKYPGTESHKGIVLDPLLFSKIPQELKDKEIKVLEDLNFSFKEENIEYSIQTISYDHYKLSTLLEWLLPNDNHLSAFTIVGHLVHLNLKDELNTYKYAIGDLVLDKIPRITCVVSKLNKIDSQYRNFQLDLLAGEANYITSVKEHGFEFTFDFSKVYWNSRLSTEHFRIAESLCFNDVVYDACAGVGPFAIPAAKKGCRVIANDLNEESCKWFKTNIELNSTKKKPVSIDLHNLDATEFIKTVALPDIAEYSKTRDDKAGRLFLIMNLPAMAINFLSSIKDNDVIKLITANNVFLNVRCYCFIGKEIPREVIEEKIEKQIGERVVNYNLRLVRNVAPSKDMYCAEILVNLSPLSTCLTEEEPSAKKSKND